MKTKEKEKKQVFDNWELKDRRYILNNDYQPLTYTLPVIIASSKRQNVL